MRTGLQQDYNIAHVQMKPLFSRDLISFHAGESATVFPSHSVSFIVWGILKNRAWQDTFLCVPLLSITVYFVNIVGKH
jgi:hypothetical protein